MKQPCEKSWQFNKPVEKVKPKEVPLISLLVWTALLLLTIFLFATERILLGYIGLFIFVLVTIIIMKERLK